MAAKRKAQDPVPEQDLPLDSGSPSVVDLSGEPESSLSRAEPEAEPEHEEPRTLVYVAPGKSITTKARGIVAAGHEVFASDFAAGDERIAELVTAGYLARR